MGYPYPNFCLFAFYFRGAISPKPLNLKPRVPSATSPGETQGSLRQSAGGVEGCMQGFGGLGL